MTKKKECEWGCEQSIIEDSKICACIYRYIFYQERKKTKNLLLILSSQKKENVHRQVLMNPYIHRQRKVKISTQCQKKNK
jgi:hypothetical protein